MNIRLALQVLRHLKKVRLASPAARQAAALSLRWVQAGFDAEMDIVWRLAVLEGVAGVPAGTWVKKGRRALMDARATLGDVGMPGELNPAWLTDADSGLYRRLKAIANRAIGQVKGTFEADDVLTIMVTGLGINLDEVAAKPAYETGVFLRANVLNGVESPGDAAGPLGKFVVQRVMNLKKKVRLEQQLPVSDEGVELDLAAPEAEDGADFNSVREVLAEVVFHHLSHPLSKKIRRMMRDTWEDSPPMIYWLDSVEGVFGAPRFPTGKEIAAKFGISPNAFSRNHWMNRWRTFFTKFWNSQRLIAEIEQFLASQGLTWELVKPTADEMDVFLAPRHDRPKLGSDDLLLRIFGRH
jgi:hypothetical protein